MTIKRKMTLLISTMLMLIVLISIVFIYNESSNILETEAEKYMAAQLDRANENISLLLKTVVLETEKLSMDKKVIDYFDNAYKQVLSDAYLTEMMREKNEKKLLYFDLFLMDHQGTIVSAAMEEAVGIDVSSRHYFKRAVDYKATNTSDIILSRADKTQIVITISPVYDENDQVLGYVGIAIYATYFSNFLNNFSALDASDYIIIDSYDHIVSHPQKEKISTQFNYFGLDEKRMKNQETIMFNGDSYRVLERELGFNNWKIISYLKYDEIYSKSLDLSYSFMKIAIVAVFIAVGFAIYLTDFISRPIVTITETINKMIEGEKDFKNELMQQLPLGMIEEDSLIDRRGLEPTEVSNFRKAILGFRSALETGAQNFELEYNKLQHYIDGLYNELETTNRRNLDFIATLSHDLRTPLTLIKGYARGLESGEITNQEMKQKFKSGIVKSVDEIEQLIYNVLDFAYEVDHSTAFDFKVLEADVFLDEIEFELEQLYNKTVHENITIEFERKVNNKNHIWIDLMNIKRVISNLVSNSLKYTSSGDAIKIELHVEKSGIEISVFDEGIGIQEKELTHIFDMFYRTEGSKEVKGYGLGLYISQQVLRRHGAELHCDSLYGAFTKMSFVIPWYRK